MTSFTPSVAQWKFLTDSWITAVDESDGKCTSAFVYIWGSDSYSEIQILNGYGLSLKFGSNSHSNSQILLAIHWIAMLPLSGGQYWLSGFISTFTSWSTSSFTTGSDPIRGAQILLVKNGLKLRLSMFIWPKIWATFSESSSGDPATVGRKFKNLKLWNLRKPSHQLDGLLVHKDALFGRIISTDCGSRELSRDFIKALNLREAWGRIRKRTGIVSSRLEETKKRLRN